MAGKAAWAAMGLPREGTAAESPSAGDAARSDTPTCTLDHDLGEVRRRVAASGWDTCVVVSERGVVLGRLGRKALAGEGESVEEAMSEGPGTVRPNGSLEKLVKRLRDRDLTSAVVTRLDGTLIGVLRLEDAERLLQDAP